MEMAVKIGGSLDRLADVRPLDEEQYPGPLFVQEPIRLATGRISPATAAAAEQQCITWLYEDLVPGINPVNCRVVVSEHEHRFASIDEPGGVYCKVVWQDVATTRDQFKAAWDSHRLANRERYTHTLMLTGADKWSMGTSKFSSGTSKFSSGTDKWSLGTDKSSLGTSKYALGIDKRSLGTNNASKKYRKQTVPKGNPPAVLKLLRNSFSHEELRMAFDEGKKSAGGFSESPLHRPPQNLHDLFRLESAPDAFKGNQFNALRFKELQKLFNDESK